MTRQVVLLRGVNVGGHRKVPMPVLRDVLERTGCSDAATYLNSGNAVVSTSADPAALAASVSQGLASALGLDVDVLVRDADHLAAVVAACPWDDADDRPTDVHVAFLSGAPTPQAVAALEPERYAPDEVVVVGSEAYVRYADGAGRSALARYPLEQRLGAWSTARNWRTVRALLDLATRGEA